MSTVEPPGREAGRADGLDRPSLAVPSAENLPELSDEFWGDAPVSRREHRLRTWVSAEIAGTQYFVFRRVFAAIWLAYDVIDVAFRGTLTQLTWPYSGPYTKGLLALQLGCIAAELALVIGRGGYLLTYACVALFLARWGISDRYFGLNDFRHITVVALLLVFVPPAGPVPRWIADLIRWETAWVYLATGFLKVNTAFLSGGHLYVRHNYLRLRGWPYPGFVSDLIERHWFDRGLALFTVGSELLIGLLLFGRSRRGWRLALLIAIAVHGGAALFDDVWFFGASMIALVWCISTQRTNDPGRFASVNGAPDRSVPKFDEATAVTARLIEAE